MNGKTCLISGSTSGIGKAAALALARMGNKLILLGRSEEKLEKTVSEVVHRCGNDRIGSYTCDLSVMRDVRDVAEKIRRDYDTIDVLINNAGARFLEHELTAEGIEMTLATNHLGHFALTLSLVAALKGSTRGRIINVSSGVHYSAMDVIENILSAGDYDGRKQYASSKLAIVLFTFALMRRLTGTGITVNAVDPGGVATNFARNNGLQHWLRHRIYYLIRGELRTPEKGAETIVYLASAEEVAGITGKYFMHRKEKRPSDISHDEEAQERLWSLSAALSGIDIQ
jgi:NAD(P)-dependent dehydrogenase (short-subunit alcohol dehydrogenase family)